MNDIDWFASYLKHLRLQCYIQAVLVERNYSIFIPYPFYRFSRS